MIVMWDFYPAEKYPMAWQVDLSPQRPPEQRKMRQKDRRRGRVNWKL